MTVRRGTSKGARKAVKSASKAKPKAKPTRSVPASPGGRRANTKGASLRGTKAPRG